MSSIKTRERKGENPKGDWVHLHTMPEGSCLLPVSHDSVDNPDIPLTGIGDILKKPQQNKIKQNPVLFLRGSRFHISSWVTHWLLLANKYRWKIDFVSPFIQVFYIKKLFKERSQGRAMALWAVPACCAQSCPGGSPGHGGCCLGLWVRSVELALLPRVIESTIPCAQCNSEHPHDNTWQNLAECTLERSVSSLNVRVSRQYHGMSLGGLRYHIFRVNSLS